MNPEHTGYRMFDTKEEELEWRQKQEEAKRIAERPKPRKIKTNSVALPEPPSLQIEPAGTSIAKAHHSSTNPPAIIAPAIENIAPKNNGAIVDLLILIPSLKVTIQG